MDWILDAKGAYDNDPGINRGMYEDNLKTLVPLLASPPSPRIDCAKAGTMTAPTLILAGERTHPYYRMIDAAWARCVPGSESATIPGADHPMSIRNPAAFNEALLTFFGDTSNCSPSIAHAPGRQVAAFVLLERLLWVREVTLDEWRLTGQSRSFAHTLDVGEPRVWVTDVARRTDRHIKPGIRSEGDELPALMGCGRCVSSPD